MIASGHATQQSIDTSSTELTEHERQVMQLVCEGRSNEEIGHRLNLSDGIVRLHVHSIYRKLAIRNREALTGRLRK